MYERLPECRICGHTLSDHDPDWGCLGGEEDCLCDRYTGDFSHENDVDYEEQEKVDIAGENALHDMAYEEAVEEMPTPFTVR